MAAAVVLTAGSAVVWQSSSEGQEGALHGAAADTGVLRQYFIAADEVEWDYNPAGENLITGEPFGEDEDVFMATSGDRIGRRYVKSVYREYADGNFSELKPGGPGSEHLGMLGPVIRAEVGDTIEVTFKNNTPFPASIHAHGVRYDKGSEGASYADGSTEADQADDNVPPGGTHVYRWEVPERAGPTAHEPSSVMWMYHSHSDEVADTYAGLMGPIIVTRQGEALPDGSPEGIDREFVMNFMVSDENASPWLEENVKRFAKEPESVDPEDEDFVESNLMHSINGYVYGGVPGLEMVRGERVRWYLMGMGTEVDLHTAHWHGNVVTAMGMRTDVVSLLPAQMVVADMLPDAAGTWLYHCHVADHISAGMQALFQVR